MEPICEELKKSTSAFVNGLGEKGEVAAKIGKMTCTGKNFLLHDGLAHAISLFSAAPGKGQQTSALPAPKAIIVIADGRDNGSATDVEKVVSDAIKRRIPIHAVGHSELDQDSLAALEQIDRKSTRLNSSH